MSEPIDRADQVIRLNQQIVDVLSGHAPATDEQGRSRYFRLITELARLGEEAGQAESDPGAVRGGSARLATSHPFLLFLSFLWKTLAPVEMSGSNPTRQPRVGTRGTVGDGRRRPPPFLARGCLRHLRGRSQTLQRTCNGEGQPWRNDSAGQEDTSGGRPFSLASRESWGYNIVYP